MKKYLQYSFVPKFLILLLCTSLFFAFKGLSQDKFSTIKINQVQWFTEKDTLNLAQAADKGLNYPVRKLGILFELDAKSLKNLNKENFTFEFKWYRYGPTRRYLTDSFIKEIKLKNINNKNVIPLFVSRGNIKRGWWEIEVVSYADNGFLRFKNKKQFQILVK